MKKHVMVLVTLVVAIALAGCAQPPETEEIEEIFGLKHTPLGAATLKTVNGSLVVSNIGSSGEDGVSIDVGAAIFWEADMLIGFSIDAATTLTAVGGPEGDPSLPVSSMVMAIREEEIEHFLEISATFESPTYRMEIFLGDELVFRSDNIQSGGVALSLPPLPDFPDPFDPCRFWPPDCWYRPTFTILAATGECVWGVTSPSPVEWTTIDGSVFLGDSFRLIENVEPAQSDENMRFTEIRVEAANISQITILDEMVETR
ncbi:MAG: hypothetical protein IH859_05410 [Chloroflexi bacterium]|nr:hypothetical protein [Chloroflexota bacterium]